MSLRAEVTEALRTLHAFREDVPDAMTGEIDELVEEYRERRQAEKAGKPIPDRWFYDIGEASDAELTRLFRFLTRRYPAGFDRQTIKRGLQALKRERDGREIDALAREFS